MVPNVFRSNRRTTVARPELDAYTLRKILIADKEADRRIFQREHPHRVTGIVAGVVRYIKNNYREGAKNLFLIVVGIAALGIIFSTVPVPPAKTLVQNAQGQVITACVKDDTLKSKACEYQNILKLYGYRK